ncbi:hypothetical protein AB0B56_17465 [Streptosporangium canum]|uniref:hypothetical protein n=1 Tax=Streptosporangium canum TaxID=324952 RepID=UPI003417262B
MSEQLMGVIIGGALAVIGGLLGHVYAARALARQKRREVEAASCEELILLFSRMRSEHDLDVMLYPQQQQDPRPFIQQEYEAGELNNQIMRLTIRMTDRKLRRAIGAFMSIRGPLENSPECSELLDLLIEYCGYVMRAERRRPTLEPIHRAVALQIAERKKLIGR